MELMDASVADLVSVQRNSTATPLPEPCIAYILREILNALVYLHSEHRMHRDIKSANVLLSVHGMVKVSDFGVAAQVGAVSGAKRRTFVGSPLYMAPEVIQQSPDLVGIATTSGEDDKGGAGGGEDTMQHEEEKSQRKSFENDGYDEAADIWSLGITAIEMARGKPPRNGVPAVRLLFLIVREPPPALEGDFSADFKDFVWQCLRKYPKDRPAAIDLLMHPFVAMAEMPKELPERIKKYMNEVRATRGGIGGLNQHSGGIGINDDDSNDTNAWDFGTVKAALPVAAAAAVRQQQPRELLPPREESLSFGTVVRKDIQDVVQDDSTIQTVVQGDDEYRNFGTVVSRIAPPPQQHSQRQHEQATPPARLHIPEPPSYLGEAGGLLSGTASTRPREYVPPHEIVSPMGVLTRPGGQLSSAAAAGVGVGGGIGERRQSRFAANGGGPKSKEHAIDTLTGMLDSLNYTKNSHAIDELRAAATANLEEMKSSGGAGSNTVDLGPLGNYLVGQWSA
jgi:serine/threonine protein kinase